MNLGAHLISLEDQNHVVCIVSVYASTRYKTSESTEEGEF